MTLHAFQAEAVEAVRQAFRTHRSVLLQLPTGAGKTHTAAAIIAMALLRGSRVVFAADLEELVSDTVERLEATGLRVGVVKADRPQDPDAPVQVASVQTLAVRGVRPPADLLILDEAHIARAATIRTILSDYPRAKLLGLTATPERSDGQGLGGPADEGGFEAIVCGPSIAELTEQGFLVPARVIAPAEPSSSLAMDPVDAYELHCTGRIAIVFAPDADQALRWTERFRSRSIAAESVLGETDPVRRSTVRSRLDAGATRVLVTCRALLKGFDAPEISAVILAAGFTVVTPYLQAIGRGLRTHSASGKRDCVVVDLRGAVHLHGLPSDPRTWSLEGHRLSKPELPPLWRCASCHAIAAGARPARCPCCGASALACVRRPVRIRRCPIEAVAPAEARSRAEHYLERMRRLGRERIGIPAWRLESWARAKAPAWVREALA